MAEKKFFVDINLQGSALKNAKIGTNSGIGSTEGAFGYDSGSHRLQYFNGSATQNVANLSDISAVTGGLIFQGGYDVGTNTPNIFLEGAALKGFFWVVTTAGDFLGESVQVGDSIVAKVDNAGPTIADWLILQGNIVIATDSVDGISRLATQTEANDGTEGGAVVITPATLQGKIDAQITPAINSKLSLSGGNMEGDINMQTRNITNVSVISVNSITNGSQTAGFDFNGDTLSLAAISKITNLTGAPTDGTDAANKTYVDGAASTAQANAEATASADATAKADAAQAAAEAYADSLAPNYDAAGSAATAESNANDYTDAAIENNSYRTEINFADWTLNGSQYEFEVTHNITSTGYPVVTFTDENDITVEAVYQAISGTAIKVIVNNRPPVLGVSLGAANPR